jgi:hypothetical protein
MSKTPTGKRITFEVEFYWRGKRKKPSVSYIYASDNYEGLPENIDDTAFHKGAEDLCKQLVEAGELD